MSEELIRRSDAIDIIEITPFEDYGDYIKAREIIENLPTIDVVPKDFHDKTCEAMAKRHTEEIANMVSVVRCKECKHRPIKEDVNGADHGFNLIAPNELERCPCLVEDGWYSWMPEDDFYCGFGEREGE